MTRVTFEEFVASRGRDLWRTAWLLTGDAHKAEDLVQTALAKVEGASGVMIGDSVYDVLAAGKLGIPTIAVRTGGFGADELQDAGAAHVFDSLDELHAALDSTDLAAPSRAAA